MKTVCGIIFFLAFTQLLLGQMPAYRHFGVGEGMPSNAVYHIVQDKNGLLWMGTTKGLCCFDGERFHTLSMRDGLPDSEVLRLQTGADNRLWVASFAQKPCYLSGGLMHTAQQDSLLATMRTPDAAYFCEASDGTLWFSNFGNWIYRLRHNRLEAFCYPDLRIKIVNEIAGQMFAFSPAGIVAIHEDGTQGGMIPYPKALENQKVHSVAYYKNRVLMAIGNQLVLFEYQQGFTPITCFPLAAENVFCDSKGSFWACEPGKGAYCFRNDGTLSNPQIYLEGKTVVNVFEDRQGTYWFNTLNEGVFALPSEYAIQWTSGQDNNPLPYVELAQGADQTVFTADSKGQLYRLEHGQLHLIGRFNDREKNTRVRKILPTSRSGVVLLTDFKVFRIGAAGASEQLNTVPIGSPKDATWLHDTLWVATSDGAYCYTFPNKTWHKALYGRSSTITHDGLGHIWVGTTTGLFSSKNQFKTDWSSLFPLLKGRIIDLECGGKNRLWVYHAINGLLEVRLQNGQVVSVVTVPLPPEISEGNVTSLSVLPDSCLWLATNKGVYKLKNHQKIAIYRQYNGLVDNEANAVLETKDSLWVASSRGLTLLDLNHDKTKRHHFSVHLTAIRYVRDGQPVTMGIHTLLADNRSQSPVYTLPGGTSLLELDFAATDFSFKDDIRYELQSKAMLLPLPYLTLGNIVEYVRSQIKEDTVVEVLGAPTRNFGVNLPAGANLFQIHVLLQDNSRAASSAGFVVRVLPMWYETIWCQLFLLLTVFVVVFYFWRTQKRVQQMQFKNMELNLQAVKARVNPHFIGNSILAIQQFFYPPQPAKASRFISLFTGLLRRTMKYSELNFVEFHEEVAYQKDFLDMIQLRFGERFQYEITGQEQVPPNLRFPTMLLQLILENATIHGLAAEGVSHLQIAYDYGQQRVQCVVTDNGPGLNHRKRMGEGTRTNKRVSNGIALIEHRIKILNYLYKMDIACVFEDLSETQAPQTGTRVSLVFHSLHSYTI